MVRRILPSVDLLDGPRRGEKHQAWALEPVLAWTRKVDDMWFHDVYYRVTGGTEATGIYKHLESYSGITPGFPLEGRELRLPDDAFAPGIWPKEETSGTLG